MLEIRNLTAGYPGNTVLHNVTACIPGGQVTVLLGPNGCGKSTLLKTLCGILAAADGEVLLDGQPILRLSPGELAQKFSYLAQNRQTPDITVEKMVLHGRFPYLSYPRRYRQSDYDAAHRAMEQMGIGNLADSPLQNLSGGQRQKVYIAMALAQNTQVVLLDEPTTYLDVSHQLQMMRQAQALSEQGKTVVMVMHDISQAMRSADYVVLMKSGHIVTAGSPRSVFDSGKLDGVFGVKLSRVAVNGGWHYFYEEAGPR